MISTRCCRNLIQKTNYYAFALFKNKEKDNNVQSQRPPMMRRRLEDSVLFSADDYEKLIQTNKYFQGIRLNTNYAKFYNTEQRVKCNKASGRKINDLPFMGSKKNIDQGSPKISDIATKIYSKIQPAKFDKKVRQICSGFFSDLIKQTTTQTTTVKIEPNFQRDARKTIASLLKDEYEFKMEAKQWNYFIKEVQIFKGLQVIRNNNYSTDSYEIVEQNGYVSYNLFQRKGQKLPEQEYFSQQKAVLRMKIEVESPFLISISRKSENVYSSEDIVHDFVIEMDLRQPPEFSSFYHSSSEYMNGYRPNLDTLTVTNVDGRNLYAAFTFDERDKRDTLINKLV